MLVMVAECGGRKFRERQEKIIEGKWVGGVRETARPHNLQLEIQNSVDQNS